MTARKPLVIVAGQVRQLAVGDTINALALPNPASIPSGTAFPASPATGDFFYRTDLDALCEWDGTRWLGPVIKIAMPLWGAAGPWTTAGVLFALPALNTFYDVSLEIVFNVSTTNNATNYWSFNLTRDGTWVYSALNTSASTAGAMSRVWGTLSGVLTVSNYITIDVSRAGSPGALRAAVLVSYRVVYT
jgi:hypothetical protein